jgi:hypothetical protein
VPCLSKHFRNSNAFFIHSLNKTKGYVRIFSLIDKSSMKINVKSDTLLQDFLTTIPDFYMGAEVGFWLGNLLNYSNLLGLNLLAN